LRFRLADCLLVIVSTVVTYLAAEAAFALVGLRYVPLRLHGELPEDIRLFAQSSKAGVLPGKIVRPGVWWGIPIQPLQDYKRLNAHLSRVPHLREELKELQTRVKELEHELRKRND